MNHFRTTSTSKGQFKCFHCRAVVRSKDGTWREGESQQIFVCKPCFPAPKVKIAPAVSVLRAE